MSDPSRLDLLRFLERVQLQQLDQTRRWIAAEEQREAEIAARQPPPEPPAWIIATGRATTARGTTPPRTVHVGGCGMTEGGTTQAITREQALAALAEGVPACEFCRPDTDLGWLE